MYSDRTSRLSLTIDILHCHIAADRAQVQGVLAISNSCVTEKRLCFRQGRGMGPDRVTFVDVYQHQTAANMCNVDYM